MTEFRDQLQVHRLADMSQTDKVNRWTAAVAKIARMHGLRAVVLFGSQTTGRISRLSDIDIAVLPARGRQLDILKLYGEFGIALDADRVDVIDLRTAPA